MSNPMEEKKMHPDLERIMNKVMAEHPHVPVPEVESPSVPEMKPSPAKRLKMMFGDNLPEVLKDAEAHARQIESTHPDL